LFTLGRVHPYYNGEWYPAILGIPLFIVGLLWLLKRFLSIHFPDAELMIKTKIIRMCFGCCPQYLKDQDSSESDDEDQDIIEAFNNRSAELATENDPLIPSFTKTIEIRLFEENQRLQNEIQALRTSSSAPPSTTFRQFQSLTSSVSTATTLPSLSPSPSPSQYESSVTVQPSTPSSSQPTTTPPSSSNIPKPFEHTDEIVDANVAVDMDEDFSDADEPSETITEGEKKKSNLSTKVKKFSSKLKKKMKNNQQ